MDKEILIQEALARDCTGSGGIFSTNSNVFGWESDAIYVRRNLYSTEFEIKATLSDYRNDQKKVQKHDILKNKILTEKPNRFFYVLPLGMIKEVPEYAGLIEYETVEDQICVRKTKKAPVCMRVYPRLRVREKICGCDGCPRHPHPRLCNVASSAL